MSGSQPGRGKGRGQTRIGQNKGRILLFVLIFGGQMSNGRGAVKVFES